MNSIKLSHMTNSHQYKKVPLNPESDSEDDEAILYAAPSLNEHTDGFGMGVYDHGRDLELPRVRRLPSKKDLDIQKRYMYVRKFFKIFLLLVVMTVCVAAVSLFIAAVNMGYFEKTTMPSSTPSSTPICTPVPKPLSDSRVQPCVVGGEEGVATTTTTTTAPPTTTSGSTVSDIRSEETEAPSIGTTPHTIPPAGVHTESPPPPHAIHSHREGAERPTASPATTEKVMPHIDDAPKPQPNPTLVAATPSLPEVSCYPVPKPLNNHQIQPCTTKQPPAATSTNTIADPTSQGDTGEKPQKATPLSWERELRHTMSETSPELHDVDGDGFDDVIVAVDSSQCSAKVMALNSRNGSTIWEQLVKFAAFALRCVVDVNKDGILDCIVSGRAAGFVALNSADGALLWSVDPSIVFPTYNFYFPLVVADMDDDGVGDIINVHGGDPKYGPEEHDRSPAFLVAVSGRTGQKIMEPVPMPDGHESYISPIIFTMNQSNQFVLFGSGGETVSGSLWAVELNSLRMRVALYHAQLVTAGEEYGINVHTIDICVRDPDSFEASRPAFDSKQYSLNRTMESTPTGHFKCPVLAHKPGFWNEYNLCFYEVLRGVSKGVVLPPVIVDMTLDGVDDLVVSMYDGDTIVLDGRDLTTVVWQRSFPGTESYRYSS
jgi:hypothetical protein